MNKFLQIITATTLSVVASLSAFSQTTIKVFDKVTFFDGYAAAITTPAPPAGITRFRNDLCARKLTTTELASIGTTLDMTVTIGALCDNYDRIGSVNLALVPKGATTYIVDSVPHIELARFITPFMNKNVQPTAVPYNFSIPNVAGLLKEASINANYDIWMELQVFGVPYAANTQVAGCNARNDVFEGSIDLITTGSTATQNENVLMPISFLKTFNNYDSTATDTLGKTTRTFQINVVQNLTDAAIFLITSNHGSNQGGEEYIRRNHFVYFDNTLKLTYKPGRTSCEPFRQYNTQANGIYGSAAKSDATWQSFSNWCPGDVIDIRRVDLGALTQGNHTFTINVPSATFVGGQGNFPLSLYLHGKTSGTITGINDRFHIPDAFNIYPSPTSDNIIISNKKDITVESIRIINLVGSTVYQSGAENFSAKTISVNHLAAGIYLVQINTPLGISVQKIQVIK